MHQQGQVFQLTGRDVSGQPLWAYRYRLGGRDAKRMQRGGFLSEAAAREALGEALAAERRRRALARMTFADLVDEYLGQHDAQPETTAKLRWLLGKSVAAFGARQISELDPREIAAWRMTIPDGHRFEATQALRQVLARAVDWRLLDINPAKRGVDNPIPAIREMRPFESSAQLRALATTIGPWFGPAILFAAATGLRPGEWIALEWRDVDRDGRLVHVRRSYSSNRLKTTKTKLARAVPLQRTALDALDQIEPGSRRRLVFPAVEGGYLDLHNWRPRRRRPAQRELGLDPIRRVYDLRHTFATFSLAAGLGTFELSRYMGTSLVNIDRHYGHLAKDGYQHAIALLDAYAVDAGGRFVDVDTTPDQASATPLA